MYLTFLRVLGFAHPLHAGTEPQIIQQGAVERTPFFCLEHRLKEHLIELFFFKFFKFATLKFAIKKICPGAHLTYSR